ncbi:hypothetical protein ACN28C_20085 [Plantactinospora sp. WMMC1484]|uniref:hypothetical protein n=1 Tax=Plantactinospora sp. WMMC1484 TaxID=3404122 RepID=UPI003BF571A2
MRSGEERRLKLVKDTSGTDPIPPAAPRQPSAEERETVPGARRSPAEARRTGRGGRATPTRRAVTRRMPADKDAVETFLKTLDQEPADTGPADTGPAGSRPADSGAADSEPADSGAADSGAAENGSSTDESDTGGESAPERREVPARRHGTTIALAATLAIALALAGVFGSQWWQDRTVEQAHSRALAAARQTTVNFVSISASSVDSDLQRITAGATGEFKEEFVRGQAKVRSAVLENKVESTGTVLRAALLSGDRRHAVVLVAMDATVRNVNAPDGRPAHYRIQVDLTREGDSDTWLVSQLQFVG